MAVDSGLVKVSCPSVLGQQLRWGWELLAWVVGSGAWVELWSSGSEAWATDESFECLEPHCHTSYDSKPRAASQDVRRWLMMAPEAAAMSTCGRSASQGYTTSIMF